MSEDMTYTPVTDWRQRAQEANQYALGMEAAANAQAARVAELEAANVSLNKRVRDLEAKLNAAVLGQQELERENAELRAKLDAVPVEALRFCVDAADYTYDVVVDVASEWLKTLEVQP